MARRVPGARVADDENSFGFGVTLLSADGSRDFRVAGNGVLAGATLANGADASDMGGEGGSWTWGTVSGGVVIMGELAVEFGE